MNMLIRTIIIWIINEWKFQIMLNIFAIAPSMKSVKMGKKCIIQTDLGKKCFLGLELQIFHLMWTHNKFSFFYSNLEELSRSVRFIEFVGENLFQGFCFLGFPSPQEAYEAANQLNRISFGGRPIKASPCDPPIPQMQGFDPRFQQQMPSIEPTMPIPPEIRPGPVYYAQ